VNAETTTRATIARAALLLMTLFVVSRALGLARDVVIGYQFGTSRALDAYFAAFNIPDFLFNLVAGGALASAFLPVFSGALARRESARAWQLAGSVITLTFLIISAIAAVLALFAPPIAALTVARGFAPADQALTADLMRWMLLTPIVFGVSGIVMSILNAHQHFLLPALAPIVYNLSIIAGALVLAPTMGVYGLTAGVVAGAFLHLLVQLPWFWNKRLEIGDWRFSNIQSLISNLQSPGVKQIIVLMLPRTLGIAAVQINFLVNTILASTLPAGRIAALGYAWRMMLLPVGVVGQSVGTAVFPTLSAQSARAERDEFRRTFSSALRATLLIAVPASVGLIMLGAPLVAVLFQRGEFNAQSTADTAFALQFYALALFAHSGLEIVTRAFYALQDTLTPVAVGVGAMALNIALSIALLPALAHGGLALANSLATILEVLVLFVILTNRLIPKSAIRNPKLEM
jgi:putative peptidoglycan lipid II flippase